MKQLYLKAVEDLQIKTTATYEGDPFCTDVQKNNYSSSVLAAMYSAGNYMAFGLTR